MRSPKKLTTTKCKARVHPASPAAYSWPLDDGACRLDIIAVKHIGTVRSNTRRKETDVQLRRVFSHRKNAALADRCAACRAVRVCVGHAAYRPQYSRDHGVAILVAVFVRLLWRATHAEPTPLDGVPPWQVQSAWVLHWLLYLMLFGIPVLGWVNASWRGMPIGMFGLELPQLVRTRAPGWGWSGDLHAVLANFVMLPLVWSACSLSALSLFHPT